MNKKIVVLLGLMSISCPFFVKAELVPEFLDAALHDGDMYNMETPEQKAARLAMVAAKLAAKKALESEAAKSVIKEVFSRASEAFFRIIVKF